MYQLNTLEAYKVARVIAASAYGLTRKPPLKDHFALKDQIRRSAGSIPANVAEGYALGTKPQLIRHLRIALGSTVELESHLDLAADGELIEADAAADIRSKCELQTRLIIGLLKRLGARPE